MFSSKYIFEDLEYCSTKLTKYLSERVISGDKDEYRVNLKTRL